MVHRRKIIVYIATSADGFIGRPDGSVDWLDRPRPKDNYGMDAFYKSIDTILWGRRRTTWHSTFKKKAWPGRPSIPKSRTMSSHTIRRNRRRRRAWNSSRNQSKRSQPVCGKKGDIRMMGGAGIIRSFLDEAEIDEFMIHVIPTFIGEGIPLIAPRRRTVPLKLISSTKFTDGVVKLHDAVGKESSRLVNP
jgi:dihydrofolate reductase